MQQCEDYGGGATVAEKPNTPNTCLGLVEKLGVARQAEGVEQPRKNEVLVLVLVLVSGKHHHPVFRSEATETENVDLLECCPEYVV